MGLRNRGGGQGTTGSGRSWFCLNGRCGKLRGLVAEQERGVVTASVLGTRQVANETWVPWGAVWVSEEGNFCREGNWLPSGAENVS